MRQARALKSAWHLFHGKTYTYNSCLKEVVVYWKKKWGLFGKTFDWKQRCQQTNDWIRRISRQLLEGWFWSHDDLYSDFLHNDRWLWKSPGSSKLTLKQKDTSFKMGTPDKRRAVTKDAGKDKSVFAQCESREKLVFWWSGKIRYCEIEYNLAIPASKIVLEFHMCYAVITIKIVTRLFKE